MTKQKYIVGIIAILVFLSAVVSVFIQPEPNSFINENAYTAQPITQTSFLSTPTVTITQIPDAAISNEQNEYGIETTPPIVLSYLENYTTIKFFCLNSKECYQSIDLSPYISKYVDLVKWKSVSEVEESLGDNSVSFDMYYISPTSVYVVLFNYAVIENPIILHFNPETNQINSSVLPLLKPQWDKNYLFSDGNLVIFSRIGEKTPTSNTLQDVLFIISSDLSVSQIDLKPDCMADIMIAGMDKEIILLSIETLFKETKHFAKVCIVNTMSGEQIEKQIEIPHPAWIYSASPDLEKFYYLYNDLEIKNGYTFGMYDTKTGEEVSIVQDQCINVMGGYQQYNNMLFSETFGVTEGNVKATLIRMDDLSLVICDGDNLQYDMIRELKIIPFGAYFLLGSRTQIVLITPYGEKVDQFALPSELLNGNYHIMEYRQ